MDNPRGGYGQNKRFFTVHFNNDDNRIYLNQNIQGNYLDIISVHVPVFDNISSGLKTNTFTYDVGAGSVAVTLPDGFYTAGADLISELNTLTSADLTWSFDLITKRVNVTSTGGGNITFNNCRLINLILGFGIDQVNGAASTYTTKQLINLFPFTHFIIRNSKIETRTFYSGDKLASLALPIDTFTFVSSSTIHFDVCSYYTGALKLYKDNIFPMEFEMRVLFNDNTNELIDFAENQKVGLSFCVY